MLLYLLYFIITVINHIPYLIYKLNFTLDMYVLEKNVVTYT